VIPVSIDHIKQIVSRTHEPQFMLPARFEPVSFDSFQVTPSNSSQQDTIRQLQGVLAEAARSLRFWQSRDQAVPRGVYIMGPPGIGKTHLLAAAYHDGPEPKLFATFDEFLAAAGTLGMEELAKFLCRHKLVCIDEIDLDDPANIMLLNSILRIMLSNDPYIIATANARPGGMAGGKYYANPFTRELGEIAESFSIIELDGQDWRESQPVGTPADRHETRMVTFCWQELTQFLKDTHPMYDARWLLEVDTIEIAGFEPLDNSDRAIRFVRFIDRVYDRDVRLQVIGQRPSPDEILAPIRDEARFHLHYIRCRSRLTELLGRESVQVEDGLYPDGSRAVSESRDHHR
jgi:cell division protein ZapE